MGWMDSKTTSSVSPEQRMAQQTAMNYGVYAANQPFQQYQGPWTAAWRPELQRAGGMLYNAPGVGTGEMQQAAGGARAAMGFQPMQIGADTTAARDASASTGAQFMGQYWNPFLTQVAGNVTSDMGRARQQQVISDEDKAIAAGAYGGSRHGVVDSETNRSFFDRLGSTLSNLYMGGFNTAAGLGMQDAQRFTDVDVGNANRTLTSDMGNADRRLRADQSNQSTHLGAGQLRLAGSTALAGIGDSMHDNYLNDAQALTSFGQLAQAYDQAQLDRDRERFNEWRDYPMRQSQIINQAAGLVQGGGTTTTKPSVMQQVGGLLGAAGGVASLFALSDEDVKSDVRPTGGKKALHAIRRTPVKNWRYDPAKGGLADGGRLHMGPMAQDVKRNLGLGDGHSIPLVDMIGMNMAATKELADKVDRITDVKIKRLTPRRKGK